MEHALKDKKRNYDVALDIQAEASTKPVDYQNREEVSGVEMFRVQTNSFATTSDPSQFSVSPSAKPPIPPTTRRSSFTKSAYSKSKSRILEPQYSINTKPTGENPQTSPAKLVKINSPNVASPSPKSKYVTPKPSVPTTPKTPLLGSIGDHDGDDVNEDDDDEVYKTENLKLSNKRRGKKMRMLVLIELSVFIGLIAVSITSLTVKKLKYLNIWNLRLWKWCVFILSIVCGRLFTEWLSNILVFLIEKKFLLKKKVLYFVFGMRKSIRVVVWLALILLTWGLLINRGVKRSEDTKNVLKYITRGIISTLVGAVLWMFKTLIVKLVASSFQTRTFFDRIQESIFHQYILQTLSGTPMALVGSGFDSNRVSGRLSFKKVATGKKEENEETINVDKLYKMKREKVSAWTMGGLIKVIRNSELSTISEVLDETVEEESGESKVITSEVEARVTANRIFRNIAKDGHKYIDEEDLLQFMPKEEVDNMFPLFEGNAESRRIKKSSFRNWVVNAYHERKCLAVSLNDAKTAIEELNKIASGIILVVIIIVWLLLMEIAGTRVLVFISSQLLLVVFMFGNTAKMVFEAMIFVFVMHPFDVGDRCVVDGDQMVVDEMNILTTIFLKPNNEKMYYPNSVLATKPISNFNRSPEMGDSVEFAVDFSTSVETIAALKNKIKTYLESKAQHWSPNHSVQIREIVDVNKMLMALYVTHTINFQNAGERSNRRSNLVFQLKKIFEELGIRYHLLPQEVQINYVGEAKVATPR